MGNINRYPLCRAETLKKRGGIGSPPFFIFMYKVLIKLRSGICPFKGKARKILPKGRAFTSSGMIAV